MAAVTASSKPIGNFLEKQRLVVLVSGTSAQFCGLQTEAFDKGASSWRWQFRNTIVCLAGPAIPCIAKAWLHEKESLLANGDTTPKFGITAFGKLDRGSPHQPRRRCHAIVRHPAVLPVRASIRNGAVAARQIIDPAVMSFSAQQTGSYPPFPSGYATVAYRPVLRAQDGLADGPHLGTRNRRLNVLEASMLASKNRIHPNLEPRCIHLSASAINSLAKTADCVFIAWCPASTVTMLPIPSRKANSSCHEAGKASSRRHLT